MTTDNTLGWIEHLRVTTPYSVRRLPISTIPSWRFNDATGDLEHESGKFFAVRGLRVGSADPGRPEPYSWWWGPWYQHQNLRDHQAEAFTTLLWDGVYNYTYTARATTPGQFVVPPAKAEEMYSPEVFGRSGSDVVVVE